MHEAVARAFYAAIDEGEYDRLEGLLTAEFVHDRPDQTLRGRETFIRFMRDERPLTETHHDVEAVYVAESEVAVRGTLRDADGDTLLKFVDVHEGTDERISAITTYTTKVASQLTEQ
ncbi:nuclear transport factor 2 family protein [Haladaptatus sp. DJG-WS-42]|uniref:nuclear transport factor 2 family protein n=1 Tax=Haladaptatus sp. DJG-WS-42 TaxID=3120516 RepID=UPI0030D620A7